MFSAFQNFPSVATLPLNSIIKHIETDLFNEEKRLRLMALNECGLWAVGLCTFEMECTRGLGKAHQLEKRGASFSAGEK